MKNILIIGVGRFGFHLCKDLSERGNQVMVVDTNEENIQELLPYATSAIVGDCTKPDVLNSLGVRNFDICFVCIGTNFQNSLEITSQLKEMGAQWVVSKATRDLQAKFLLRNGADEVVYPERDVAEKFAMKCGTDNIFDYIELNEDYSIYEIPVLPDWVGKSVRQVDFRAKYHVSILGVKDEHQKMKLLPLADYEFKINTHLLVIGEKDKVHYLLNKTKELRGHR